MSKKPKRTNFSLICRTCMSTKSLIPIFDGKASINYYSSIIFMVCGVKVEKEDGLPQKLCKTCIKFIKNTIEFRKQSQSIELMLLKIKNNENIEKAKTNINIIKNSPADDLSDDETLIKYVNKDRQNKLKNITSNNNLNKNSLIKTETNTDIPEVIHKRDNNNIITEKNTIKNENKLEYKQIGITNNDQNNCLPIKEEMDHVTDKRRSYNHNDTVSQNNDPGYNHNDIETEHTSTKDNNTKFHNHFIGYNHNSKEISHNDSGYNHNDTGASTYNSLYDDNDIETHNEARNNHNGTETSQNDSGNNYNIPRNNTITYVNNNNETENNENSTETCHNDSGYNPNETKTHNEKNTIAIEAPKNNRVSCKICYKDLSYRSLDVHMSKCHPDLDERKTKCDLCSSYVTKNRMKRHMTLHGDRFLCVYCMKEQSNIETLKVHTETCVQRVKKRSDNNSAKELKECDICKKVMQKGSLRLHKRLKHAGLGPVCEHCGKKLSNKFRLSEHLRAKHGYEKHKCSLCDFQTAFRVHLKNHERRHRGEKPYICETCGTKYHSQNQLIQHRYTHNVHKDYKCEQCPSSFRTTVHLSVHKNTTHSTQPMCCSVCTRYFRCRHYLLKHMRNVHRVTGVVAFDQIKL